MTTTEQVVLHRAECVHGGAVDVVVRLIAHSFVSAVSSGAAAASTIAAREARIAHARACAVVTVSSVRAHSGLPSSCHGRQAGERAGRAIGEDRVRRHQSGARRRDDSNVSHIALR